VSDISMDEGRGENLGQGPASATDPLKDEVEAAREKMGDAAHAIQAETAHFAEAAKDKASDAVEQSKETVLNAIGDFAEAIRKAGEELSDKDLRPSWRARS
jgi:phosphate uptake regulator